MERLDGYLVIDGCSKKEADYYGHYWVLINDNEYYFKPTDFAYNELIGYQVAKIMNIDVCYCDLAILNGKKGVVSKSLRSDNTKLISGNIVLGEFMANCPNVVINMGFVEGDLERIIKNCLDGNLSSVTSVNNLEVIREALVWRYGDKIDINEVKEQFILMYLFSIIVTDVDKSPLNWLIVEMLGNVRLGSLIDNEWAFRNFDEDIPTSLYVDFDDSYSTSFESLNRFLNVYYNEYFNFFVDIFEKVVISFGYIIGEVEKQTGVSIPLDVKEKIVIVFNKNVENIRKIINEIKEKKYKK